MDMCPIRASHINVLHTHCEEDMGKRNAHVLWKIDVVAGNLAIA